MKVDKFLLLFLILFFNNFSNSFGDDGMMQRGLEIFNSDKILDYNKSCGSSETYNDLREQKIYEKYQ